MSASSALMYIYYVCIILPQKGPSSDCSLLSRKSFTGRMMKNIIFLLLRHGDNTKLHIVSSPCSVSGPAPRLLHMEKWLRNYCFLWKSCNYPSTQEIYIPSTEGSFVWLAVLYEKYAESIPTALAHRAAQASLFLVFLCLPCPGRKKGFLCKSSMASWDPFPQTWGGEHLWTYFSPWMKEKVQVEGFRDCLFFFFWGDGWRAVLSEGCSAALLGLFSSWNLQLWTFLNPLQSKWVCKKKAYPNFACPKRHFRGCRNCFAQVRAAWDLPRGQCWDTEGGLGSQGPGGRGAVPGTPGSGPCSRATICHRHGGQAEISQSPFKLLNFFNENKVRWRFLVWVSLVWLVK